MNKKVATISKILLAIKYDKKEIMSYWYIFVTINS